MFKDMRSALSIPTTTDILEHIESLPTPSQQASAHKALREIETRYMREQAAQPGLVELMAYLEGQGPLSSSDIELLPKGICTRNFDMPVQHLLEKFLPERKFDPIITRDFKPPKPHPAGILHIARTWGIISDAEFEKFVSEGSTGERELPIFMVGDSMDDMLAGRRAGAATVLLRNEENGHVVGSGVVDLVIETLDELVRVLDGGFVGSVGGVDGVAGRV